MSGVVLQLAQALMSIKPPQAEGAFSSAAPDGAPGGDFLELLFRKLQEGAAVVEPPFLFQGTPAAMNEMIQDAVSGPMQVSFPLTDTADTSQIVPLEGEWASEGGSELIPQTGEKSGVLGEFNLNAPPAPRMEWAQTEWARSSETEGPIVQFTDEHASVETTAFERKQGEAAVTLLKPVNPELLLRNFSKNDVSDGSLKNQAADKGSPQPVAAPLTVQGGPSAAISGESARAPDVDNLLNQIVQGARLAHRLEGSELQVHLKPELLGKMSIKVISDMRGLRMEIKAENEVVRQIMQDSLPDLQQRLAEKGVFLNELALLTDSGGTFRGREEEAGPASSFLTRPEREETSAELAPLARLQLGFSVIDYLA